MAPFPSKVTNLRPFGGPLPEPLVLSSAAEHPEEERVDRGDRSSAGGRLSEGRSTLCKVSDAPSGWRPLPVTDTELQ